MTMQKTGYLIFLTVFVALVVATGKAQTVDTLGYTLCGNSTVDDYACHGDRCHNTTTYIYDCATFPVDDCIDFNTHFVICNSTGTCRNTTRDVRLCLGNFNDDCIGFDFTTQCCTNGACHNRTTDIDICLDSTDESYKQAATSVCASDDHVCNPFFPYDPTCTDRVIGSFRRHLSIRK